MLLVFALILACVVARCVGGWCWCKCKCWWRQRVVATALVVAEVVEVIVLFAISLEHRQRPRKAYCWAYMPLDEEEEVGGDAADEEEDGGRLAARNQTWRGTATGFANLMAPHAAKTILMYSEHHSAAAAPVDPDAIIEASAVLATLHEAWPSLLFKRSTVRKGFAMVARRNEAKWNLGKFAENWVEVHTRRLINLLRAVRTSLSRRKPPAWTKRLPWLTDVVAASADRGPEQPIQYAVKYCYDYDQVLRLAIRYVDGSKKRHSEPAVEWLDEAGLPDHALAKARWADGDVKEYLGLTVGFTRSLARGATIIHNEWFWQGTHSSTHHGLVVKKTG